MALEFYVEQADRAPESGLANESIYAGELAFDDGDGVDVFTYALADGADGNRVGLARYDAQAMAAETMEDVVEPVYDAGQRVQYQALEDSARFRIRTAENNGTDPAPNIGHKDVVGVIDASGGTASSADEFQGRVVEEGYTDDSGTTYDRSTGNFIALGTAYRPEKRPAPTETVDYDYPVRVTVFGEPKA